MWFAVLLVVYLVKRTTNKASRHRNIAQKCMVFLYCFMDFKIINLLRIVIEYCIAIVSKVKDCNKRVYIAASFVTIEKEQK